MTEEENQEPTLGIHKGQTILELSALTQKGNRVVKDSLGVDSSAFDCEPGTDINVSVRMRNRGERFVALMSKDDPDKMIGWERVLVFDMLGAIPDARSSTARDLDKHMAKLREQAQKDKGQLPMDGTSVDDEFKGAEPGEIRPGVPDDEGAGEQPF